MTLEYQILGNPGRDNVLYVRLDSGGGIRTFLFDCGEGCLSNLSYSQLQAVEHLFFSHFHMDHVCGFDSFFRCNYNRSDDSVNVWGPIGSASILQHRFQGYWWNIKGEETGTWFVNELQSDCIVSSRFELKDAFEEKHEGLVREKNALIIDEPNYTVSSIELDHKGPSIGYKLVEKPTENIDGAKLASLGLRPGPWIQELKAQKSGLLEVDGKSLEIARLRADLVTISEGRSIAYLTDFLLDEEAESTLIPWLNKCDTLVCEAQYRKEDKHLASRYFHSTTEQTSLLAKNGQVGELVLIHLSQRYMKSEWSEMLAEAREIFPNTKFPDEWAIE
ncbi:MBL fold metallo-hydrolase [bacterium]|nr:MBL fold metallo-hydrolase [bacterium]